MEIFDQFRAFFRAIFQLHVFIYGPAVAARFWNEPLFMAYVLVTIAGIFKAYPTAADAALSPALLSVFSDTYGRMQALCVS